MITAVICVTVGYIAGKYWSDDVERVTRKAVNKITNKK
jgi:hypothetical protein